MKHNCSMFIAIKWRNGRSSLICQFPSTQNSSNNYHARALAGNFNLNEHNMRTHTHTANLYYVCRIPVIGTILLRQEFRISHTGSMAMRRTKHNHLNCITLWCVCRSIERLLFSNGSLTCVHLNFKGIPLAFGWTLLCLSSLSFGREEKLWENSLAAF